MGETVTSDGTESARPNTADVSGESARPGAHLVICRSGSETHDARPDSSWYSTHWATSVPASSSGRTTRWRIRNGVAVRRSETVTSPSANWFPAVPSSVRSARIWSQPVGPLGAVTVTGSPGARPETTVLPASVVISALVTSGPSAFAVVRVTARSVRGVVKPMRIHRPTAVSNPPLTQALCGLPSKAAAAELAGEVCPGWTASAADPDVDTSTSPLSLSNNHSPWTSGWPSTG